MDPLLWSTLSPVFTVGKHCLDFYINDGNGFYNTQDVLRQYSSLLSEGVLRV